MPFRTPALALVGALALSIAAAPAAGASAATAPQHAAALATTTLYYDDSQAAEFKSAVVAGAQVWNANVRNVRLVEAPAGTTAQIRIIAFDGWPQSTLGPVRPGGRGTVYFGREAVDEGYNTTRIAAHELGHILGLPDAKPGPCSSLMSGSTGGVSCTNATPNASERAAVERNYGGAVAAAAQPVAGGTVTDAP
ncbi:snapalysin family zinc-dependent metalloprotease [Actinoallomurus spadix]|uniref:Extracellular small neutral protease n=1 Tax=Actinoallomurus spadix TaxID=79912 RepID=A0ABN0XD07_9ACTN|nr:snapalysin family zinc-dependent metalloprotease [Actinoallomurus spadix]MCO5988695.1 snapalysin family zinc-dependent metalloprotease [Actinoallomurus spadix]